MNEQTQGQAPKRVFEGIEFICDWRAVLDLEFDPRCQIDAIRSLLQRQKELEENRDKEIERIQEEPSAYEGFDLYAEGKRTDMLFASVYQDAAHSMAAVGMMSPLLETVFAQCFEAIGRQYGQALANNNGHARWKKANMRAWDCHYVLAGDKWRETLAEGILQLSDATGLREHLPENIDKVLAALFAYRNKMFHCGFEWPVAERESFAKRIVDEGWPTGWFQRASQDGRPWIFYMSHEFVDECQLTFEKVLDAFCELIKKHETGNSK